METFWSSSGLPRCKELAWRASSGYLPVRTALVRRGVDVEVDCPLCGMEPETVDHLWIRCAVTRAFWFGSPLALRLDRFDTLHDFLSYFIDSAEEDAISLWQATSYALWEARNRVVFEGRAFSVPLVVQRAQDLGQLLPASGTKVRNAPSMVAVWQRPTRGVIKINFDASFRSASDIGAGMVARDHEGFVLASAAAFPLAASSPLLAEAAALRWAMVLAIQLGFRRVCFETDCLQLFQRWTKPPDGASYLVSIINDCFVLSRSFDVIDLSFVRRSGNAVADLLARKASSFAGLVWIEEVPSEANSFISTDLLASVPVQV
ncbi:uncharacterized protein LOC130744890 [Lotus japonicus]|uniref:uncharacterized protein LOC130744890 n=1 Tax=Lotus japonicus TaxID=34305 RepID=UPI002587DFFC|nr:uncharacterized protein LOC130744890 [Lotus japonicus]